MRSAIQYQMLIIAQASSDEGLIDAPIAAPSITSEFGLNPVQSGVVISAFGWTYTPLQIPGGWLVDRIHGCSTRSPSSSGRSQRSVSGSPPASSC
jgi:MFS family permease